MAVALEMLPIHRPLRMETPVLIDRRTWEAVGPSGHRRRLRRLHFAFLDTLTRDMGAVIERRVMIDALWPDDADATGAVDTLHVYAREVRDVLVMVGWTREVIVARNGVGWQIDVGEVERVMREVRGLF